MRFSGFQACSPTFLLGIRDASQFCSHPLVGNIFENMVIGEAVKHRLNQGLEPDFWFYCNSSGSIEVDLLIEDGVRIHPREIKSSSTSENRGGSASYISGVESRAAPP